MGWRNAAGAVLALALACTLQGCAQEDGSRLLGHWRAERFEVMSLKLPVGPELRITRDKLASAGGEIVLPIAGISEEDDEVTIDTDANIGLTFYFVEPDRMYVKLPLLERVYYRRVTAQAAFPAAHTSAPAPAAGRAQAPVRLATPAPQVAAPVAVAAPVVPGELAFGRALAAARAGDDDSALRQLHQAFQDGFTGAAHVANALEFGRLRSDVRFQVLLARYTVQ